ncbi:6-phosphogluconolactonase [Agrobacterium albertimagni AOL15]|uniref:6-phosphogluconolactonase n=1 Tax=Agrobacterium albertimagni AOL15 TaxID=1156935 RepID=K2Q5H2_9HYPH|nr:6-phosphogluconolactonase [Agrobacterium albertimagni]EKF58989.1 6-phosphogluconolactonase [Agrobacterium albertimagni AOL15]
MAHHMKTFETGAALAAGLADAVASALSGAIANKGAATLAVSGGSTPKAFFEALSTRTLDWPKVKITLVDERFVDEDNPRSNHLLVKTHLLKNEAAAAEFVPLYRPEETIEEAAKTASGIVPGMTEPFDVAILGMGTDGHTASFFPGGDHLDAALDLSQPRRVMTMEAPGAGEARLTLSFSALHDAVLLVVHIEGAEKKAVLDKALAGMDEKDMPIRAVLERARTTPDIYWAP